MIEIFKITHGVCDNLVTDNFLNLKDNNANSRGYTYRIDMKGCRLNIRLNIRRSAQPGTYIDYDLTTEA